MGRTHLAFSVLLSQVIYYLEAVSILSLLFLILGGYLPDIDAARSWLGTRTKIFAFAYGHRGFFHSLSALSLFSLLFYTATMNGAYALMFSLGYGSHLLLDALTKSGIQLLYPLKKPRLNGFIRTNSGAETLVRHVLWLTIILFFIPLFL